MGDTVATNFTAEDRISRYRKAADKDNNGEVTQAKLNQSDIRPQLNGLQLPGMKVDAQSTNEKIAQALGKGTGVVSNRSLFSIPNSPNHVQSSEMNIGDASNYTRLRAAGLTEAQLNNPNNIFVHLGQDSSGKEQYGFYSKGFGEGDERTGVVTVGEDGQISSSLGAGWSPASEEQQKVLKDSYEAREQLIKDKFGSKFEDYSKFEKARSQVDDLLARSDIDDAARNELVALKKKMDPSNKDFNLSNVTTDATTLLQQHSIMLTDIQKKEAEGKVDDPNDGDLDNKLTEKTKKVNTLNQQERNDFKDKLSSFKIEVCKLKDDKSTTQAFKAAEKYLSAVSQPDKSTLAELNWQMARLKKLSSGSLGTSGSSGTSGTSGTSGSSGSSKPSAPSKPQYQAGDTIHNADSIARHLGFQGNDPGSCLQSHVEGDNSIGPKGFTYQTIQGDNTKFLLDSNNEQFLYDTQAQTATKLASSADGSVLFDPLAHKWYSKDPKTQNCQELQDESLINQGQSQEILDQLTDKLKEDFAKRSTSDVHLAYLLDATCSDPNTNLARGLAQNPVLTDEMLQGLIDLAHPNSKLAEGLALRKGIRDINIDQLVDPETYLTENVSIHYTTSYTTSYNTNQFEQLVNLAKANPDTEFASLLFQRADLTIHEFRDLKSVAYTSFNTKLYTSLEKMRRDQNKSQVKLDLLDEC